MPTHAHAPAPPTTVLVVDGDTAVRSRACTILQARGYRTLAAADGLIAWQILIRHRELIHLLVTDLALPGLNGGSLVELARELWPHLPVLILSTQPQAHSRRIFATLQDISFLRKPFRTDDLTAIVTTLRLEAH